MADQAASDGDLRVVVSGGLHDPPKPSQPADVLKPLGGAAVALAALVGAGAVSGALAVVARNHDDYLYAAVGLALAAAVLWTATALSPSETTTNAGDDSSRGLIMVIVAAVCLGGAAITLAVGAIKGSTTLAHPNISGALAGGAAPSLKVTVKDEGLPNSAILKIRVRGLTTSQETIPDSGSTPLYASGTGPNASGDAQTSFSIPVDEAAYAEILVVAWVGNDTPGCLTQSQAPVRTGCAAFFISPG